MITHQFIKLITHLSLLSALTDRQHRNCVPLETTPDEKVYFEKHVRNTERNKSEFLSTFHRTKINLNESRMVKFHHIIGDPKTIHRVCVYCTLKRKKCESK